MFGQAIEGRFYLERADRGLLAIEGEDRRSFLQGLISNDVTRIGPEHAIYAAFLNPQGRFLHEFFIIELDGALYLDCEAERLEDLRRRLSLYRLRAKVSLREAGPAMTVAVLYGSAALAALELSSDPGEARAFGGGLVYVDPRTPAIGARAVLPREPSEALAQAGFVPGNTADYEGLRLTLGLPDGSRDLEIEKALPLENGFDACNGIDWQKGCYIGQEVTARMKHRALVKRRLMPVRIDGPPPAPGSAILFDGAEAGQMRTAADGIGLALLRLEVIETAEREGRPLDAGESRLTPLGASRIFSR